MCGPCTMTLADPPKWFELWSESRDALRLRSPLTSLLDFLLPFDEDFSGLEDSDMVCKLRRPQRPKQVEVQGSMLCDYLISSQISKNLKRQEIA